MRYFITLPALFGMALAQDAPQVRPGFEVAAIRPHEGPLSHIADFHISGPRVVYGGYTAFLLIMEAYKIRNYQVSASEKLPIQDYYEIAARAPGAVTRDESRVMLQVLLADRFRLQFHREMREIPVYALVVDKNGPLLKPSSGDEIGRASCRERV